MKLNLLIQIVILLTLILVQKPLNLPAEAQQSNEEWKLFKFDEDHFSISFPDIPQKNTQETTGSAGTLKIKSYFVDQPEVSYVVSTTEMPAKFDFRSRTQEMLENGRDKTVKQENGMLVQESELTINGFPGIEFSIATEKGLWQDHLYLTDHKLYVVITFTAKELLNNSKKAAAQRKVAKAFFDSFILTISAKK